MTTSSPDYVSAETLAQRLDCSKTTVHAYVRRGILPEPIRIGDLVRWRWVDVEKTIKSLEAGEDFHVDANDPYFAGIERGKTQKANH
jgi:predicted DNA-binding transcriptional regulator AlpA